MPAVSGPLALPHRLGAILAGIGCLGRSNANIKSSGEAWRNCRGEDIGRAQARGSFKQAKNLCLSSSIGKASGFEDDVSNIVVAASDLSGSAAESMVATGIKDSTASPALQRSGGEASAKSQSNCGNVGCRLQGNCGMRHQRPQPLGGDRVVLQLLKPANVSKAAVTLALGDQSLQAASVN